MKNFLQMSRDELVNAKKSADADYAKMKSLNLKLDMSRGKPNAAQLDTLEGLLSVLKTNADCISRGTDARNYGGNDGLPEAKELFAELMEVSPDRVIVGGNSSLNMMYDTLAGFMLFGTAGSTPWCKLPEVKFICPVPGYDRHFTVTEALGIKMITVPMTDAGPGMNAVRALCEKDESVKGIWCCPKYSNPEGVVYSDETVRELAALKPAAKDFRIMWDNAYIVHFLGTEPAPLLNILDECEKAGCPDRAIEFVSTSKISYPGGGVAALASGEAEIAELKKRIFAQTIGPDKLKQLAHVRYFKNRDGVLAVMKKYADAIRPRFELVLSTLERELGGSGAASWKKPEGGYFVSVQVMPGTAKRVVALCKEAGVTLTGAGAAFPYKNDPDDSNIRIAPTYPPFDDLRRAMDVFTVAVKLAAAEKLLG